MDRGFSLIEALVVVTIIALLAAILIPVTNSVRKQARVVVTKSNINTLSTGVEKFYNDMGSYPPSEYRSAIDVIPLDPPPGWLVQSAAAVDIGAHRLVEALVGIDLLGYSTSENYTYYPTSREAYSDRQGLYVDIEADNLTVMDPRSSEPKFTCEDLNISAIGAPGIVENRNPMFIDESGYPLECRPILYYKADKREAKIGRIYNADDNYLITEEGRKYPALISADPPDNISLYNPDNFEGYIWDPASGGAADSFSARPYNKDTFLLIAAGPDGIYGSEDDICNFNRK